MEILDLFTKEQCKKIVNDFELHKDHIGISTEHGEERISSYEIDYKYLSTHVKNMIDNVIMEKILSKTGGKVGMVFGVKYSMDTKPDMEYHYDCSSYSCVIKLNDDYSGGGTYFPFMDNVIVSGDLGQGVIFKADKMNSYHKAHPITDGIRYVLVVRVEKDSIITQLIKASYFWLVDYYIRKFNPIKNPHRSEGC